MFRQGGGGLPPGTPPPLPWTPPPPLKQVPPPPPLDPLPHWKGQWAVEHLSPSRPKVTISGKNEIYLWENLVGPFLVHKLLGPRPRPPSCYTPPPSQLRPRPPPPPFPGMRTGALPSKSWLLVPLLLPPGRCRGYQVHPQRHLLQVRQQGHRAPVRGRRQRQQGLQPRAARQQRHPEERHPGHLRPSLRGRHVQGDQLLRLVRAAAPQVLADLWLSGHRTPYPHEERRAAQDGAAV